MHNMESDMSEGEREWKRERERVNVAMKTSGGEKKERCKTGEKMTWKFQQTVWALT